MSRFVVKHRVEWADVDLAKIVHFPRFFSYYEIAELEWIRAQGLRYEDFLEHLNIWMPRVAAHCDYLCPARLADLLSIEMALKHLGRTSFTLSFDIYRLPERTHLAEGCITIATVSRDSFHPIPIPEKLVKLLDGLKYSKPVGSRKK